MKKLSYLLLLLALFFTGCLSLGPNLQKTIPPNSPVAPAPLTSAPGSQAAAPTRQAPAAAAPTTALDPTAAPSDVFIPLVKGKQVNSIFGAQLDSITPASGLALMADAKSQWTRRDFVWQSVEPKEGRRDWAAVKYYEDELVTAYQNNIHVIVILLGTPDWASGTANTYCGGKVKSDKLAALANFTRDLVARYSRAPYNVKYFEMWNEPDVDGTLGCWGNNDDKTYYGGGDYGEMLKVVYPAAKSANADAQILVGGLLLDCAPASNCQGKPAYPANFLNGILNAGAGNSFDGVAFHAGDYYMGEVGKYSNANFGASWNTTGPMTAQKAHYLKDILAHYNVPNKYLVSTEAGIKCDPKKSNCTGYEETKAYYVVQDGATALAENFTANIWYSVYGDGISGLLTKNNNQPLPAYYAFQYMISKLANHTFVQAITSAPGVKGYEFVSGTGKKLWVVWSMDGLEHLLSLTTAPVSIQYIDPSGHPANLPTSNGVQVGIAPVFIQY